MEHSSSPVQVVISSSAFLCFGFCHMEGSGLDGGGCLVRLEEEKCIREGGSVGTRPSFRSRSSPSKNGDISVNLYLVSHKLNLWGVASSPHDFFFDIVVVWFDYNVMW